MLMFNFRETLGAPMTNKMTLGQMMQELIDAGLVEQPAEDQQLSMTGWWRQKTPLFTSYETIEIEGEQTFCWRASKSALTASVTGSLTASPLPWPRSALP